MTENAVEISSVIDKSLLTSQSTMERSARLQARWDPEAQVTQSEVGPLLLSFLFFHSGSTPWADPGLA